MIQYQDVKPLPVENSPTTLLSAVLADDDRLTAISLAESLERHGVKAVAATRRVPLLRATAILGLTVASVSCVSPSESC